MTAENPDDAVSIGMSVHWMKDAIQRLPGCAFTMQPTRLGRACVFFYRRRALRPLLRLMIERAEGGVMFSPSWRIVARKFHGVEFGAYSYSPYLKPGDLPRGTWVGRFCSLATGLEILRRNHPTDFASQHPLFFNRRIGLLEEDAVSGIEANPLRIGHDVWIGVNTIILPQCREIGNGAIVAAGSVVTRNVPAFTVVGGNPARPIRKRFPTEVEEIVDASQWWLEPLTKLVEHLDLFTGPLVGERLERFCSVFQGASTKAPAVG